MLLEGLLPGAARAIPAGRMSAVGKPLIRPTPTEPALHDDPDLRERPLPPGLHTCAKGLRYL